MFQNKKTSLLFLGTIVLSLFIGFKIGNWYNQYKIVPINPQQEVQNQPINSYTPQENRQENNSDFSEDHNTIAVDNNSVSENNSEIPGKVYEVLKYIRQNHEAPSGYVGGRVFSNREKILPQFDENHNKIRYQEWDVNPKVNGRNRGTERLVTSDVKAYYTNNHYKSFTEVNE